jgi:phosphate transport system substrate-binding protein
LSGRNLHNSAVTSFLAFSFLARKQTLINTPGEATMSGCGISAGAWQRLVFACCCAFAIGGCVEKATAPASDGTTTSGGATAPARGPTTISSDGSSTVYPISQAVAEKYKEKEPNVEIAVGYAGTSGGFKQFVNGQIDICNASRAIKPGEVDGCAKAGIEYLELQVAVDGLTVAVNKANDWVDCMSVAQLKKIWEPGSKVTKWSDVDPGWPDQKIELFGADADSGTFDYFTEEINGKSKATRTDYTNSSNDNILVRGVANEKYALGYFGFGYYVENQHQLKALSIKAGDDAECVAPNNDTIENHIYKPLSRPLFIYVNKAALKRPEVVGYLKFYLSGEGQQAVTDRKYVRMKPDVLAEMQQRLEEALAAAK